MKLSTSREEYLKVIFILKNERGTVRSIDIAQYMGISKPSVCAAVKQLQEQGYIEKDPAGIIELTDTGRAEAKLVFEMHCFFEQILIDAGISHEQAHTDAGKLEHAISEESYQALKKLSQTL